MTTKFSRFKSWLIGAAALATLIVGYSSYNSAMNRRGSLALHNFQLLAALVQSESRRLFSEATGTVVEYTVVSGSSSGHSMADAELDYKWEICPGDKKLTKTELAVLRGKIEANIRRIISDETQTLGWDYPQVQLATGATIIDSTFFHEPAIAVSLKCNN